MKDQFEREISYVRLSVTQRCNLRCVYCQPDDCPESTDSKLLSVEDNQRLVSVLAGLGIRKVRLTGGEPLLRRDLEAIIVAVSQTSGITDVSLTTNGQGLAQRATGLKAAGLGRVNISLDTLCRDRYRSITGGGSLQEVLSGIDACLQCGLTPVKLNTVLVRGMNDDEIDSLIELTRDRELAVRFIELMPLNDLGRDPARQISGIDILASHPALQKISGQDPGQPSEDYQLPGYSGTVGFIRPISHRFCHHCNRIRITADGILKPCLGDVGEVSLIEALNQDEQTLQELIRQSIFKKPEGHHFNSAFQPERSMNRTGG